MTSADELSGCATSTATGPGLYILDERTTVFTLDRAAFALLSDGSLPRPGPLTPGVGR